MSAIEHVIQRGRERYGLRLVVEDVARLRDACRDRAGVLLGEVTSGCGKPAERWLAMVHGVGVIALYSRPQHFVITLLPPDDRSEKRRREKRGKRRCGRSAAWPDERRAG